MDSVGTRGRGLGRSAATALASSLLAAWSALAGCAAREPGRVDGVGDRSVPALLVDAPESLEGTARVLRELDPAILEPAVRLTGLAEPGPPIRVVLAAEGSATARSAPGWVSGYASGRSGLVVLFPARVGRYPDRGLEPLLAHEVAHVLIARAARGRPVPRWFDEGLAMAAGRERDVGDRARVALAVLRRGRLPLTRLDEAFSGGTGDVLAAYALARDLVRELLRGHDEQVAARILARLGRDEGFEAAFRAETGTSLGEFETDYWDRRTLWDRWVPLATSSVVLWGGITFLALAAFRRRALRDARIRRRWELEEQIEALRELERLDEEDGPRVH